jgi:hypothetical protein
VDAHRDDGRKNPQHVGVVNVTDFFNEILRLVGIGMGIAFVLMAIFALVLTIRIVVEIL